MRRYFFDLRHGDKLAVDEEGTDLPNIDAVQKMAVRLLADMAQDLIDLPAPIAVEVQDKKARPCGLPRPGLPVPGLPG